MERLQKENLKTKEGKKQWKVEESLETLKNAAETDVNLMPYILDSVRTYATLGEICGVLREVFGEYEQSVIL